MKRFTLGVVSAVVLAALVSPADAYLGGFENADGYSYAFTYPQLDNWVDVTQYNAGAWGPNAGGGSPFQQTVNTGLWTYTSAAGSAFDTQANRVTYMGATPTFNSSAGATPFTFASYFVGGHFGGRLGTNALAVRNAATNGAMKYDYRLDAYDFSGTNPATVTSGTIGAGLYFQANPADNVTVASDGSSPEKFFMSIKDTSGNVGLQWGYRYNNSVIWRAGGAGPWISTALTADDGSGVGNYDGINFKVDLTGQTFSLSYYDVSANVTTVLAPAGTLLGSPMTDFTHLGWYMGDNVYSGVGGKNFFDDFSFQAPAVPEPGTVGLLLLGGVPLVLRRRRGA
jgi:hypothetical protein